MTAPLILVVGVPGAGKTTALRAATAHLTTVPVPTPVVHRARLDGRRLVHVELGRDRYPWGGADTLSMNAQPRVVEWLAGPSAPPCPVVADGDRLGNPSMVAAATAAGRPVALVHLDVDPDVADVRRRARSSDLPSSSWLAGRATKVSNLVNAHRDLVATVDANRSPAAVAAAVRAALLDAGVDL